MKSLRKLIILLASLYAGVYFVTKWTSRQVIEPVKPYFKRSGPYIFAHRGGAAIAPEHTNAAFKQAHAHGVDGFEIDVRLTKDEEIVVMHDLYIDRTSNNAGKVSDYTLEELRAFDFGYHFEDAAGAFPYRDDSEARIMTLQELIEKYPDMLINIDIKDEPDTLAGILIPKILKELIDNTESHDRVLVTSFHDVQIERFRLYSGQEIATGAGVDEVKRGYFLHLSGFGHMYQPRTDTFQIPTNYGPLRLDNASFIQYLRRLNVVPGYWTINRLDEIESLIDKGAHTIVTDHPEFTEHIHKALK